MIYLIGVSDHNIQHNGNNCACLTLRNKFSAFLKDKIKEYNIDLLAEEFNKDCLEKSNANIATVQDVAKELKDKGLKIEHKFCEMSKKERKSRNILSENEIYSKKLNIHSHSGSKPNLDKNQQKIFNKETEKSFLAREAFWFEKISDYFDKNILFLCGPEHIESFLLLLNSRQYKVTILCKQYSQRF